MEVGGLVVGVVGVASLATLFYDCIESFDCFRAADKDFEGLLVELDMEKARLLYWGNGVGLLNAEGEGQATELKENAIADLIERALKNIKEVLADADVLQQRYGLRVSSTGTGVATVGYKKRVSSNLKNTFDTSWTRFCIRSAGDQPMIKRLSRARWAIHDKGKFEALIIRLRTRVSGLSNIVPINKELEDQTIQEDIASIMNISQLRLVESVCEGPYPRWAERASTVREATESGTVDRRHVEEWLRDSEEVVETMPVQTTQSLSNRDEKVQLYYKTKLFFVLSGECLNTQRGSTCDQNSLGKLALTATDEQSIRIFATHGTRWSIGRRIARKIDLSDFADMYAVREYRLHFRRAQFNGEEPDFDGFARIANVYIYCAPCACLVHAALEIANEFHDIPELELFVRVDDRLVVSCCSTASRIDGLSSLCKEIRELELNKRSARHHQLDRDWIGQRVFSSSEEKYRPVTDDQRKHLQIIQDEHRSDNKCAAIIILGETDYCSQMMRHPSFSQSPRMPRETEFYMMKKGVMSGTWERNYVGAYVPNSSAVPTTQPAQTNSLLTTSINAPGTGSGQSLTNSSQLPMSPTRPSTDTTQTFASPPPRQSTPPLSPNAKRQRTSASSQHE